MRTLEELKKLNNKQLLSEYSAYTGKMQTAYNAGNIEESTKLCWYANDIYDLIIERMSE